MLLAVYDNFISPSDFWVEKKLQQQVSTETSSPKSYLAGLKIAHMESIKSPYSISILEKTHIKRRPLDQVLKNANKTVMDLLNQMINFNPHKRIDALHALKHPYVRKFFNSEEIMTKTHHVVPPLDDNVQLTVTEYRNRLYQIINSKKLRKHIRTKSTDQSGSKNASTTYTENDNTTELLTVRNTTPVENSRNSSCQGIHWKENLPDSQTPYGMRVDDVNQAYSKSMNKISTNRGCPQNPNMDDWNPENTRPISDLATYAVVSKSSVPVARPCSQIETTTTIATDGPSRISEDNSHNDNGEEKEPYGEILMEPSEVVKSLVDQTTTANTTNTTANNNSHKQCHAFSNKASRMCNSTTGYYSVNEAGSKISNHNGCNIGNNNNQSCIAPSNLQTMQNRSESTLNNLNTECNKSTSGQIPHSTTNNDTDNNNNNMSNGQHNSSTNWKLNASNSNSRMNNAFRKSFSSTSLPSVKGKLDYQTNAKITQQQNQMSDNAYSNYQPSSQQYQHHSHPPPHPHSQHQYQSLKNSTLNLLSNEQVNVIRASNGSLTEIKRAENSVKKSDESGSPLVKTLTSINNRLNHLLATSSPASSSTECLNYPNNNTANKFNSSIYHQRLTTNHNSSEQNIVSNFNYMDNYHKYKFSKSTNNLFNNLNASSTSGYITPSQKHQTTSNLSKEQEYKSNFENKTAEPDAQNRRFSSAPMLPTSLSGYLMQHKPIYHPGNNNVSSSSSSPQNTTNIAATTNSASNITHDNGYNSSISMKYSSKVSSVIGPTTGGTPDIRLHSTRDLDNLFQDYRLRRTSASPLMDEVISANYTNGINNHNGNSSLTYYHRSSGHHYDTSQSLLSGNNERFSEFRKSPVKNKSGNMLDTVMESTNNSRINSTNGDSQASKTIRSKSISNGTCSESNNSLKYHPSILPSTIPVFQSNDNLFHPTRSANLKQPAAKFTSTLKYSNKSVPETVNSNKHPLVINHTRQRLVPQHVLSRLKSFKDINNGETGYSNHII
uniref:Protein kinase domain-containing protein n=1 Tax=Trichobilharzia regenti TaxID=157069 RepID=A0AA85IQC2_TRIRE|nr:unnamed protein product [Trichobilharzia regenti]